MGQADAETLLALYRSMAMAREVDRVEEQLTRRGEAFFHVSGAGHEGSAALAFHLQDHDWLHCHYRDKALMIARGMTPRNFLDGVLCNLDSLSRGRQLSAHLCHPERKIMSQGTPVGNSTLHAVGVAAAIKDHRERPLVLCASGDGTTQEGEYLEACSEAVRRQLPVLFFIENNAWAISTKTTGNTFFSLPRGDAHEFYGMRVERLDGRNVAQCYVPLGDIVQRIRERREPELVVFDVERLHSHSNADDQSVYRDHADISLSADTGDPVARLRNDLQHRGISPRRLDELDVEIAAAVKAAENEALAAGDPDPVLTAKRPLRVELTHPAKEHRGVGDGQRLPMKDAIREVLRHRFRVDQRVTLYGQDIEDPKGDVFGVTKGLSTEFPGRVCNAPLADFFPLAYNQIATELGSMYWRTNGRWQAPVIVLIPCGGYRPGLGPFHSHSLESVAAHIPGVDVFLPATATDAAGLLNAAFESQRPTLVFYPKSCLNDPENTATSRVESLFVPIGVARKVRSGRDITFVGWGNTVRLCERTAEALESAGIDSEVLDLRSIAPWDERAVLASVEKTARLVVVHEDNQTCGLGAEVLATVAEKSRMPVAARRVARPDTFVPCNFANQLEVLPSFRRVVETSCDLLDLEVTWQPPPELEDGLYAIEAVGSGPSDETVIVVQMHVESNQTIKRGDTVATLEASKSVFDLSSPVSGMIQEIHASAGDTLELGTALVHVKTHNNLRRKPITRENPGNPIFTRRTKIGTVAIPRGREKHCPLPVGMSSFATVTGSRRVTNEELAAHSHSMSAEDILRRTGIESRQWAMDEETAVEMASGACWQVLDQEGLIVDDLDVVICATTSPTVMTPSMACQILNRLANGKAGAMVQAYDINAACSGYLYALQSGFDYLQSAPHGRVLLVTAELLSPLLDLDDLDTAIIFGDAASASVLYGAHHIESAKALLRRPDLSAKGEDGSVLSVPFTDRGYIHMQGRRVFSEAVRTMISSLHHACEREDINASDLALVVPHQANGRIIDAMDNRVDVEVFSNIRHYGNTSSTSIPLCLVEVFPRLHTNDRVALCAFGGGFTFGAAIVEAA